jgi:hypothetical protein
LPSGPKAMNFQPWWVSVGKPRSHHLGPGRVGEPGLDSTKAQDAADRRDIQVAVAERHANRHIQPFGDHPRLAGTATDQRYRIDLAGTHAADEQGVPAEGHLPRVRHLGEQLDVKPGRQPDLRQGQRLRGGGQARYQQQRQRGAESMHYAHGRLSCNGTRISKRTRDHGSRTSARRAMRASRAWPRSRKRATSAFSLRGT